ncbi:MAG: hypothetical protein UX44_C0007G0009 [candidate division WWE3 bacterium GW2011_GWA1_46_21]|uniref:YdbS-like PH domain-containing protein n=3 Tax=Katanobacteria TaxID=422282 RepID=A0A0G1SD50_UNCKA|nr:MAG: hypothetical protein UX44_C0007G0009 [candidate division WWE3 bacterium GW2011_GWA1_46_21]KKU50798.1 MAG: hypothetical protein UX73_C0014G0005 [candidate division WWE3 bacterium GW2011_GWC1_47_10]KKU57576.1 MAG: hypothetical protein UX79_C0008G0010 [candidate division WWE3 bacterium GW2011_GWB1_47_11]
MLNSFWRYPKNTWFDGEDHGEEILLVLRRHLITNLDWIFVAILLILTPFFANAILVFLNADTHAVFAPPFVFIFMLFWFLFTFGFVFENFINWFFNVYIVTNKRIVDMDFHGILFRNISEATLANVEDVTHTVSGTLQVVFNYGDVIVQTAGEQREFDFESVPSPARVQDIISDLVAQRRHP